MNRFHFTLQSLLDSREALESAAAMKLAAATHALEKARQECRKAAAGLKKAIDNMEALCGVHVTHDAMSSHLRYIERLQYALAAQSKQAANLEAKMEACRNKLQVAMRERKVLERLCEVERDRWKDDQRRYEQKEMDEYARTRQPHDGPGKPEVV